MQLKGYEIFITSTAMTKVLFIQKRVTGSLRQEELVL